MSAQPELPLRPRRRKRRNGYVTQGLEYNRRWRVFEYEPIPPHQARAIVRALRANNWTLSYSDLKERFGVDVSTLRDVLDRAGVRGEYEAAGYSSGDWGTAFRAEVDAAELRFLERARARTSPPRARAGSEPALSAFSHRGIPASAYCSDGRETLRRNEEPSSLTLCASTCAGIPPPCGGT